MNIVENIRRIGIFMIAAQTVMHFAAGKQYEKYMKIITSVIVLMQFMSPFLSSSGNLTANWQAETERIMKQIEDRNNMWQDAQDAVGSVETVVLQQIEEEVKSRLNDVISDDDCRVADVVIDLEETAGEEHEWSFQRVRVILQGESADGLLSEHEDRTIRIEEITIGDETEENTNQHGEQDLDQDAKTQKYRQLFALTLGVAETRVEVTYRGGW